MLPTPVNLIFRYFYFIAFGISLLNLWMAREKVTPKGKVFMILFASLFLMWGIFQLIGGYNTLFFVFLPPTEHPLVILSWLIYFAFLWGVAAWVLFGNGANELLQSGIIHLRNIKPTVQAVKALFIALSIMLPLLLFAGHALGIFDSLQKELPQLFSFIANGSSVIHV